MTLLNASLKLSQRNIAKATLRWVCVAVPLLISVSDVRQIALAGGNEPLQTILPDSIVHYDISGTASAQIRAQLQKLSPMYVDGKQYAGKTTWSMRYRTLGARAVPSGCEVRQVEVSVSVFYTMPRWVNLDKASAVLSKQWREYYAALLTHEEGHAKIAHAAADTLRAALTRLPANVPCATFREQQSQVNRLVLDQFRKQQAKYDEETQHGRTQGAVFPPP